MSAERGTAVIVRVINVRDYHRMDLLLRTNQIKDSDIPQRNVSLSHVISIGVSFRMYGFESSCHTLSETFHPCSIADYVATPSAGGITVGLPALKNGAKDLLLEGFHHLKAWGQLHVEGNVCRIQQYILVCVIFRENTVDIS